MKKFIALLLLGSLMLLTLSSCRKIKDPFKTSLDDFPSGNNSVSANSFSGNSSAPSPMEIPEDPFYSMSALNSAKVYGIPWLLSKQFDNQKYYYEIEDKSYENAFGDKVGYKVLYRYPYGHPEKKTVVCTDPLCSHRPDSGCAFVNLESYWAYKGTLFYFTVTEVAAEDTFELCMYDQKKGKKVVLDSGEYFGDGSAVLRESGENLYYCKDVEGENFETYRICYRIDEQGKLIKIAEVGRHFGSTLVTLIYNDRKFVYASPLKDNGEYYDRKNGEETIYRLGIYDLETKKEYLVRSLPSGDITPWHIYGNKLLYRATYPEEEYTKEVNGKEQNGKRFMDGWYLLNMDTMEEETVLEHYDYDSGWLTYYDCCFFYTENRSSEEESLIFHVVFPQEDREEVYDLSALVGKTLSLNLYVNYMECGAVKLLSKGSHSYAYEVDLMSGRVRPLNPDGTPA